MFPLLHLDPTAVNDETPQALVGGFYNDQYGQVYQYVKNASADTNAAAGKWACDKTAGSRGDMTMKASEVTSGTLGTVTKPRGMWMSSVSYGNWGYILVVGETSILVTDDGVADGDSLVCDGGATETFIADTAVAGEEHAVVGRALAADNDTTHLVRALINCL